MDRLVIRGGQPLRGSVTVSGAKNAALPAMAAVLLTSEELVLKNIPPLRDVATIEKLLKFMGVESREGGPGTVCLNSRAVRRYEAPYDLVRTMRASVLVLGPLLAKFGEARVSLPGGCAIGPRPINLHLAGLQRMGAEIDLVEGYVVAKAPRLSGTHIAFEQVTVTGTENLMMAATLAKGTTVLENAAQEPEVEDLACLLQRMGAQIEGAGTSTITIEGVEELTGAQHPIIPDRIEAATLAVAAAITQGDVLIQESIPEHFEAVMAKLREAGATVVVEEGGVRLRMAARPHAVDITTAPFPGFATDMQAQIMALMAIAHGRSVITETVFENRFMHIPELVRMGADITFGGRMAVVQGVPFLRGAPVMATDLRASASLVLAALQARGETVLHRVYHLDRGYERLETKLRSLGGEIRRVEG
ncbi:MAG: UDP-N-acetylglucosamine 1-carboxyvinyltransferase [Candidatus Methylomirabilales bacterium]